MKLTMMILSVMIAFTSVQADGLTEYDVCPTKIKTTNETGTIRLVQAYGMDAWLDCGYSEESQATFNLGSSKYKFSSQELCLSLQKSMDQNPSTPYSIKLDKYSKYTVMDVKVMSDKVCDEDGRAIWK